MIKVLDKNRDLQDIIAKGHKKPPKGLVWEVEKKDKGKVGNYTATTRTIKGAFDGNDFWLCSKNGKYYTVYVQFVDVKDLPASIVVLRSDYIGVVATPVIEDVIRAVWHNHDLPQCTPSILRPLIK